MLESALFPYLDSFQNFERQTPQSFPSLGSNLEIFFSTPDITLINQIRLTSPGTQEINGKRIN